MISYVQQGAYHGPRVRADNNVEDMMGRAGPDLADYLRKCDGQGRPWPRDWKI